MNSEQMNERLAEAARYALMRRLAPAIRHDMAGVLQPISMLAAMLEKRLQKPAPDMQALAGNSSSIGNMSREAATSCMRLMSWIAPKEDLAMPVDAAVKELMGLLNTEMSFRGFTLVNETGELPVQAPCRVLRSVLAGSLIALTDAAAGPANVVLKCSAEAGKLAMSVSLEPTEGEAVPLAPSNYRQLDWDDVASLARAEGVELTHTGRRAELVCPY